ncbi:MAG: hypothetical protein ACMXYK_03245 [Candidatus Woesearchaeota archaeon]
MNIGCYMDESSIFEEKDSTLFVLSYLKQKGHTIELYTEEDPELCSNDDTTLLRFNIPLRNNLLENLEQKKGMYVNRPQAIRNFYTKDHILLFPEITTPSICTNSPHELSSFVKDYRKVVIKPMDQNGGKGISLVTKDTPLEHLVSMLEQNGSVLAQEYIPSVIEKGDKRIHVINGEAVSALLRLPSNKESFICNLSSGGRYVQTDITKSDRNIVNHIAPFLLENGIYWAGIDVIDTFLGEINVVSPGAVYECDRHNNYKTCAAIERMLKKLTQ